MHDDWRSDRSNRVVSAYTVLIYNLQGLYSFTYYQTRSSHYVTEIKKIYTQRLKAKTPEKSLSAPVSVEQMCFQQDLRSHL